MQLKEKRGKAEMIEMRPLKSMKILTVLTSTK
jgi:hypothetical protein